MFTFAKLLQSRLAGLLLFSLIAVVYISRLSPFVQMGDTGELVTAAFKLYVPHPPGYPLWVWVNAVFMRIVDYGSVFWRASLLSVFFSLGCLYFVWRFFEKQKLLAIGSVLVLAFSRIFWRYSELPDVFILNALFASAILYFYFSHDHEKSKKFWIPFLFILGLTNHHTLVFLLPLVIDAVLERRQYKLSLLAMVLGTVLFLGLYVSLLMLNPESLHSWGNLASVQDILGHLLRKDYGTFQLVSSNEGQGSVLANWLYLGTQTLGGFYAYLAATVICIFIMPKQHKHALFTRKFFIVLVSLCLYGIVFFALSNTPLIDFRYEVLDRFIIQFHLIFLFLCGYLLQNTLAFSHKALVPYAVAAFIVLSAMNSLLLHSKNNDFSKNSIIEDYAINFLNEAPNSPTVIFTFSDTRIFAFRYVQQVLGHRPDVLVLGSKALLFPWYAAKIKKQTALEIDLSKLLASNHLVLYEDLLKPNLDKFSFLTNFKLNESEDFHQILLPLGRILKPGKGLSVYAGTTPLLTKRSNGSLIVSPPEKYDIYRDLWTEYSIFEIARFYAMAPGLQTEAALSSLQTTLDSTPWSYPLAGILCKIKNQALPADPEDCTDTVDKIKNKYLDYY